jgi:hypothetical protein
MIEVKGHYEILPNERNKIWVVEEEFTVETRFGKTVTVPDGFRHDRFTVVPDLKRCRKASIVHDKLYEIHEYDDGTHCTRFEADIIFLDLMKEGNYNFIA